MKDPRAGKYRKIYMREFQQVGKVLKGRNGCLEWSQHDYQAFTYFEPGASLVFYPHQGPSSRLYWLRVRDQGSKSKELAQALMALIYEGAGISTKP